MDDFTEEPTELVEQPVAEEKTSNLAARIKSKKDGQKRLDEIGATVVEEYDQDTGSRTDFDKRRALWRRFFSSTLKDKTTPWPNSANVNTSFITTAVLQYQARAFEALIQKDVVKCLGPNKDAGDRVANFMNWQLRFGMPEWEEDMDTLLVTQPLDGLVVKKTYRNAGKNRNYSRMLSVDEFVVSYKCKRLEDATRKTHAIWMPINEIKKKMQSGLYLKYEDTELVLNPQQYSDGHKMPETKDLIDSTDGVTEPQAEYTKSRWILEQQTYLDVNWDVRTRKLVKGDGINRPFTVTVDQESQKVLRIVPAEYVDIESNEIEVWEPYTAYPFIPNPDSVYSLGFGQLLYHLQSAANTSINMLLDAGHLNNIISGLIAKRSGVKKGDLRIEMGLFTEVDIMNAGEIKNAIYQFQFKEPSTVLFNLLGLLHDYSMEITTKSEFMTGQMPPSDTAATSVLAIIEQGLKVFSTIQKRNHRSLTKESKKLFILNRQYPDEQLYREVMEINLDEAKTFQSMALDFASTRAVIPASDPNITSRAEELITSQQTLGEVKQNPLTAQNPESMYHATKAFFRALRVRDIDRILPAPKPPPPPPDLPPEQENAEFIKDKPTQALPQQNHVRHLQFHEGFIESVWGEELTPNAKNMMDSHMRDHKAFLYMQEESQRQAQEQGIGTGDMGGMNG
jgi:hypothetical protein